MVNRQMNLIWETTEAEGKYWAFSDVECPCNFRPVAMDNCPPNLRSLQQDFNIVLWVLNEYLPRLLTMQVVWEVIMCELLWKVLKTKICINRHYKFWNQNLCIQEMFSWRDRYLLSVHPCRQKSLPFHLLKLIWGKDSFFDRLMDVVRSLMQSDQLILWVLPF